MAFGLPWAEALRAVTLAPAEVFGLAGRIGSLQAGRDANVVVWSGDPFEFATRAERVFIRGVMFGGRRGRICSSSGTRRCRRPSE